MIDWTELATFLIIAANIYISYRGFKNRAFYERYLFDVGRIVAYREADRIVTSGFLHANWGHLLFNMIALYSFSVGVQLTFGTVRYLGIYFGSLIIGSLLALYIHRDHGSYRAVGASGAVSGIIFASIVAFPHGRIVFLFLPVEIPSWLFGIGFVLISIFGIGARVGRIGHEAHLGGAMAGVALAVAFRPELLTLHPLVIIGIVVPMAAFLYLTVKNPGLLRFRESIARRRAGMLERQSAERRRMVQEELDRLLDKVNEHGIRGLSHLERRRLRDLAEEKKRMGW
jgi:membrane associated rhomboid family serine protease